MRKKLCFLFIILGQRRPNKYANEANKQTKSKKEWCGCFVPK